MPTNKQTMPQNTKLIQSQTQQQVQTLSPQQIMVVKLLELPALEFEEQLRAELIDNPALEEGREESEDINEEAASQEEAEDTDYNSLDDYSSEDEIPDYKLQENNRSRDERAEEIPFSDTVSFYDLLLQQLSERDLSDKERQLTEYLIGSLNEDGRLEKPLPSIADDLLIYHGVEASQMELEKALRVIQDFDPAGIGARDLQECLQIQVHRRKRELTDAASQKILDIEDAILSKCFDEFTRKRWDKIQQRLNLSEEETDEAIQELCRLNPRPGAALGEAIGKNLHQIIPDFIIEAYDDGSINVSLNNRNVPELRISRSFRTLMHEHKHNKENQSAESNEAILFVKHKIDAAQNFIDAIKQRQNTLLTTMRAIVELQKPFFLEGDESLLRPMILKDVAERTGLDISTISRVSNSKYAQTNYGIYPLKFFFSDGFVTEDGEEMSVREIKNALLECVANEDKKNPYTDDELKDILAEKGYPIARRTVAKYRHQLNIPVARLRK